MYLCVSMSHYLYHDMDICMVYYRKIMYVIIELGLSMAYAREEALLPLKISFMCSVATLALPSLELSFLSLCI